jgi:2-dehydro-3-deoxygalactonokinase
MRGEATDATAFARGVDFGVAGDSGGLARKLFSVRTLGLFDRIAGEGLRDYLSGLLIGDEIREAMRALGFVGHAGPASVRLIGDAALAARYRDALARAGIAAVVEDETVTPRGLARVARAAGLLPVA